MAIQRWYPFRDLRQMENSMNRIWRGLDEPRGLDENWNILIDVIQKPEGITVKASVPGIDPEDIDVAVEDNILTLRAEKRAEYEEKEASYLIQERAVGSFFRALSLPDTVDTNKIQCQYDNGILTITMPKAEEKMKKKIKVEVKKGAKEIEGGKK